MLRKQIWFTNVGIETNFVDFIKLTILRKANQYYVNMYLIETMQCFLLYYKLIANKRWESKSLICYRYFSKLKDT